jgi:hypothetical protein
MMLAEVYAWFTESFDTAGLKRARPCSKNWGFEISVNARQPENDFGATF